MLTLLGTIFCESKKDKKHFKQGGWGVVNKVSDLKAITANEEN